MNSNCVSNELIKKALSKVTRLKSNENINHMKISKLFSLLRLNTYNLYYESLSDNINRAATNKYSADFLNNSNRELLNKLNILTFSELDSLLNGASGTPQPKPGKELFNINVFGWCKSIRRQNNNKLIFVILNDGSCKSNLQIVVHDDSKGFDQALKIHSGASIKAQGILINRLNSSFAPANAGDATNSGTADSASPNAAGKDYVLMENMSNQYELHVTKLNNNYIEILGCNMEPNKYPIAKKNITMEYLRDVAHLRARSYLISACMRVRSALAVAIHLYFQKMGCLYLNTPIITTADCEGAGELFQVTTLFENVKTLAELGSKLVDKTAKKGKKKTPKQVEVVGEEGKEGKREDMLEGKEQELNGANSNSHQAKPPKEEENELSFSNDFFKKKSYLTCSGQLSAENYCCSMGSVYTFGPTFRAENSHTNRHLSEFWMIEPELALVDLPELMHIAEDFVKFLVQYVLKYCYDDLHYFNATIDGSLLERLHNVVDKEFVHITYTEVINILQEHVAASNAKPDAAGRADKPGEAPAQADEASGEQANEKTGFVYNDIYWGMDLQSEHERFICEKIFNCPVIIYNYPKKIKAFYMRRNEDGQTVMAMDLIIPKIGELIGGSQREERLDLLVESIHENGLSLDDYWWYVDLRKYGTITHSGFGLGFERLIMMVTGVSNIKDVIPFPRYSGHSSF